MPKKRGLMNIIDSIIEGSMQALTDQPTTSTASQQPSTSGAMDRLEYLALRKPVDRTSSESSQEIEELSDDSANFSGNSAGSSTTIMPAYYMSEPSTSTYQGPPREMMQPPRPKMPWREDLDEFLRPWKDVQTLYEISDDPKRKDFLDDLFSFMQRKGTPINRLPIMAKSVLDLFELYNLVVGRGGLVEVINKKLWQEIIKGLRLPSSITSAAFTLRTQYMKYLYEYECEKMNLSTRDELEVAIEGNKREGRRASGQYDAQAALAMQPMNRLPANLAQFPQQLQQFQHLAMPLPGINRMPPLPPPTHDGDKMREYMAALQKYQRSLTGSESPPSINGMPPGWPDMSRMALWSFYNSNAQLQQQQTSPPLVEPEPQRLLHSEALNLSESPGSSSASVAGTKREASHSISPVPKRRASRPVSRPTSRSVSPRDHNSNHAPIVPKQENRPRVNGTNGAAFKLTTRGDAETGDQQLVVSIEINGVMYEGVLFPSQGDESHRHTIS